jgi:hypothetical protein
VTTKLAAFTALCFLTNCGVEVGNPHPKPGTGSTGALTLALADAPVDDAQHVYFNLIGMRVVPQSDGGGYGQPIAVPLAATGKIDALALSGGKSLELSTAQAIAPGSYSGVILDLDQSTPGTIVAADGSESPLDIADLSRGIFVSQSFDAVAGEELKLTLHVDLRRSIKALTDDGGRRRFAFGPVAHMLRQGDEAQLSGTGLPAEIATACAYLRRSRDFNDGQFGPIGHGGRAPGPDGPGGPEGPGTEGPLHEHHDGLPPPPPPPGFDGGRPHLDARLPPSVGPDADVSPDADAGCDNAFATASVTDGSYLLAHLWPGEYHLAFYRADGTRFEAPPLVVGVHPGEKLDAPVPATPDTAPAPAGEKVDAPAPVMP